MGLIDRFFNRAVARKDSGIGYEKAENSTKVLMPDGRDYAYLWHDPDSGRINIKFAARAEFTVAISDKLMPEFIAAFANLLVKARGDATGPSSP